MATNHRFVFNILSSDRRRPITTAAAAAAAAAFDAADWLRNRHQHKWLQIAIYF